MKKIIMMVVAFLFLWGFNSFTVAQEKNDKPTGVTRKNGNDAIITGKVISVDWNNKQIVVKDNKTQTNMTFTVSEEIFAEVKVEDEVKVKTRAGNTNPVSVNIVKSEEKTTDINRGDAIITGKVISVDWNNKQIVVKDNKTQTNMTFTVTDEIIAEVKVKDEVKIKIRAGNTNPVSVNIVESEGKNEKRKRDIR